jgi:hypothetical protein
MSLDYDAMSAFVRSNLIGQLRDNIFEKSTVLKYILQNQERKAGRNFVETPILYGKTEAAGGFAGWQTLELDPNNKWTAAEYTWRAMYAAISLSFDQIDAAGNNDMAIANLLTKETDVARKTLQDMLSTALYNDGTDSLLPQGLRHVVKVDRTLGGIDSTKYTWWDANVLSDTTNYSVANLTNPDSEYYILKLMRRMWRSCEHLGEKPNFILMTGGFEDLFEQELGPYIRYGGDIKRAQVDFTEFSWKGQCPMITDDSYCPDGHLFMINTDWFKLVVDQAMDMRFEGFQKPVNKAGLTGQIFHRCQFSTGGPRNLGLLRAADAVG